MKNIIGRSTARVEKGILISVKYFLDMNLDATIRGFKGKPFYLVSEAYIDDLEKRARNGIK